MKVHCSRCRRYLHGEKGRYLRHHRAEQLRHLRRVEAALQGQQQREADGGRGARPAREVSANCQRKNTHLEKSRWVFSVYAIFA